MNLQPATRIFDQTGNVGGHYSHITAYLSPLNEDTNAAVVVLKIFDGRQSGTTHETRYESQACASAFEAIAWAVDQTRKFFTTEHTS